jgi:uncharacterized damage-inducible protein DinB
MLDRIPEDKLSWKPHEKSFSLGELAWHIALTPAQVAEAAVPDVFEIEEFTQPDTPDARDEILFEFDKSIIAAKQYLKGLDDATAMADWKVVVKGQELMSVRRIDFLRGTMFNHLYHHRGQLSVYLRLLDVPVPAIYGPSADEPPYVPGA